MGGTESANLRLSHFEIQHIVPRGCSITLLPMITRKHRIAPARSAVRRRPRWRSSSSVPTTVSGRPSRLTVKICRGSGCCCSSPCVCCCPPRGCCVLVVVVAKTVGIDADWGSQTPCLSCVSQSGWRTCYPWPFQPQHTDATWVARRYYPFLHNYSVFDWLVSVATPMLSSSLHGASALSNLPLKRSARPPE